MKEEIDWEADHRNKARRGELEEKEDTEYKKEKEEKEERYKSALEKANIKSKTLEIFKEANKMEIENQDGQIIKSIVDKVF